MKRLIIPLIAILFFPLISLRATHNKGGEITFKKTGCFSYEFTITTYTHVGPGIVADRDELVINYGDGTKEIVPRYREIYLPNYVKMNTYIGEHTFPNYGTYLISMEDPNRNDGVVNIPNSVDQVFFIESFLTILPGINLGSSIQFDTVPQLFLEQNQKHTWNISAFVEENDTITYEFIACKEKNGNAIKDYYLPKNVSLDRFTGKMTWDNPSIPGQYSFAIKVSQWKSSKLVSYIIRDFLITIE